MFRTMVVIPTLNERENIDELIREILALDLGIHILVVDDDSPDGTAQVVSAWAERRPEVHLLLRRENRGRGHAGVAGFKQALAMGADYIIEMDADFSHHPSYLPDFVAALADYDMILGSRYIPGGQDVDRGRRRRWISKAANWYERTVLGVKVRDCTSGFRAYRRCALVAAELDSIRSPGPALLSDILFRVHRKRLAIGEIPIVFADRTRGSSTLTWRILVTTIAHVIKLRVFGW